MDDSRQPGADKDAARVKRQLIVRGVVAAGLIVALLAALVVFERSETANEPPAVAKTVTQIGPSLSSGPDVDAQSASLADQAQDIVKQSPDAPDVNTAALDSTSAPAAEPEEDAAPTMPPPPQPAPAKSPRLAIGKTPRLVVEQSSAKTPPPAATRPARTEVTKTETPKPEPKPEPTKAPAQNAVVAFFVQLGVFSNTANAEELRTRLTQNGIASHLETRVQLGPFNTREEAAAAQEKLRKLGLESGMVVPAKK